MILILAIYMDYQKILHRNFSLLGTVFNCIVVSGSGSNAFQKCNCFSDSHITVLLSRTNISLLFCSLFLAERDLKLNMLTETFYFAVESSLHSKIKGLLCPRLYFLFYFFEHLRKEVDER